MPKYLKTKDGSLESAVLEAVSPTQQIRNRNFKKRRKLAQDMMMKVNH